MTSNAMGHFRRPQYQAICKVLLSTRPSEKSVAYLTWKQTVDRLAFLFKGDNPTFNTEVFLLHAGEYGAIRRREAQNTPPSADLQRIREQLS